MGGLIVSIAMSWMPNLIQKCVLLSPMLRNKCSIKYFNYTKFTAPQPVGYLLANLMRKLSLGSWHALGFLKEKSTEEIEKSLLNVMTSSQENLEKWKALRMRYPHQLICTCVTNDWLYHSIRAQNKFSEKYGFVRTNTLIIA